jgi:hypothetical protein
MWGRPLSQNGEKTAIYAANGERRVRDDDSETTNLAGDKPEILNEHKGWLKNWIAEVRGEILPQGGRL